MKSGPGFESYISELLESSEGQSDLYQKIQTNLTFILNAAVPFKVFRNNFENIKSSNLAFGVAPTQ